MLQAPTFLSKLRKSGVIITLIFKNIKHKLNSERTLENRTVSCIPYLCNVGNYNSQCTCLAKTSTDIRVGMQIPYVKTMFQMIPNNQH